MQAIFFSSTVLTTIGTQIKILRIVGLIVSKTVCHLIPSKQQHISSSELHMRRKIANGKWQMAKACKYNGGKSKLPFLLK